MTSTNLLPAFALSLDRLLGICLGDCAAYAPRAVCLPGMLGIAPRWYGRVECGRDGKLSTINRELYSSSGVEDHVLNVGGPLVPLYPLLADNSLRLPYVVSVALCHWLTKKIELPWCVVTYDLPPFRSLARLVATHIDRLQCVGLRLDWCFAITASRLQIGRPLAFLINRKIFLARMRSRTTAS